MKTFLIKNAINKMRKLKNFIHNFFERWKKVLKTSENNKSERFSGKVSESGQIQCESERILVDLIKISRLENCFRL